SSRASKVEGLVDRMVRGGSSPLGRIKKDLLSGAGSVNDGGGANPISGYTVIEADEIETAVELVKRVPIVEGGRTGEIAEATTALWGRSPPSMVQLAATPEGQAAITTTGYHPYLRAGVDRAHGACPEVPEASLPAVAVVQLGRPSR